MYYQGLSRPWLYGAGFLLYPCPKSLLPAAASPTICVDTGHLKGEHEGVVLDTDTNYSNNKLVMTAFAIVP